jgi:hypothetical protein
MRTGRTRARGNFRAEDRTRDRPGGAPGNPFSIFAATRGLEIVSPSPRICVSIFGESSSNRADLMKHNHLKSLVSFPSVAAADKAGGKKLPRSALWTLSPAALGGCNGDAI